MKSKDQTLLEEAYQKMLTSESSPIPQVGSHYIWLWEAYGRDGDGVAMYLHKADAEACEAFENGCDRVVFSLVRVSSAQLKTLCLHQPVFA
jgi:hypothetical protein